MDTAGYDYLVSTPEAQAKAIQAHVQGVVEYLMTHVQLDQLNALLGSRGPRGHSFSIRAALLVANSSSVINPLSCNPASLRS